MTKGPLRPLDKPRPPWWFLVEILIGGGVACVFVLFIYLLHILEGVSK